MRKTSKKSSLLKKRKCSKTGKHIRESERTACEKGEAVRHGQTELNTLGNGIMIKFMGSASFGTQMKIYSRANLNRRRLMGMVSIYTRTGQNMKVCGRTMFNMGQARKCLRMGLYMREIISKVKCLEKEI